MKRALVKLALCSVALCGVAPVGYAEPAQDRSGYIAELIDAIRATDHAALANTRKYIQIVERNKCQAPEMTLRVGCMLEAAAQNCKQLPAGKRTRVTDPSGPASGPEREACQRASDVIAANQLSERLFVPNDVRYAIMSKQRDARTAIARELHHRYAQLVTELAMSKYFPGPRADSKALGTGIDGFCTDVSGTRDLSWQYCVAAIVWFVATDGAEPEGTSR
ncbi:MAG TPA: hypothetical protein VFV99_01510 [Kofleriaceae bacterium]|nr:hypothetical protein [Kofleriaceae bacterium]